MKVQVYYQEFRKNAFSFGDTMYFNPEESTLIQEANIGCSSEDEAVNTLFEILNFVDDRFYSQFPESKEQFKKAGHTSMSVGDYIVFPGTGNTYICASVGWKKNPVVNVKKLV